MKEALKYSPLWVSVYAWDLPKNGIQIKTETRANHCVMVYGYDDDGNWLVYDHYENDFITLAPDYKFWGVKKIAITEKILKVEPMLKIPNNTLVQLVEGAGGFGLVLDNKIITDDLSKLLATFVSRNSGNIANKTMSLTQLQWDSFPKMNLKKELL
jgi:hypothetical protein